MGFDRWGVLPGLEHDEYILVFGDTSMIPSQPFGNIGDSIPEKEIRAQLKKMGKSEEEIDQAIAKANEERKKSR